MRGFVLEQIVIRERKKKCEKTGTQKSAAVAGARERLSGKGMRIGARGTGGGASGEQMAGGKSEEKVASVEVWNTLSQTPSNLQPPPPIWFRQGSDRSRARVDWLPFQHRGQRRRFPPLDPLVVFSHFFFFFGGFLISSRWGSVRIK